MRFGDIPVWTLPAVWVKISEKERSFCLLIRQQKDLFDSIFKRMIFLVNQHSLFVDGEEDSKPDDNESDKSVYIHGFVKMAKTHEKLKCGIDVHQDPGNVVRNFLYTDIKKQ